MAAGVVLMVAGGWAGLSRMGWAFPTRPGLLANHGVIMVVGFLGTAIGVERAVGAGRTWAFAAPILTSAGAIGLALGAPVPLAGSVMALGALVLALTMGFIARLAGGLVGVSLALSGVSLLLGTATFATGGATEAMVGWLIAFLVLVIAGERLELSRLLSAPRWAVLVFGALCGLLLIGIGVFPVARRVGITLAGVSLVGLSAWLLRYDISARLVRAGGRHAFSAVALLAGYVWLAAAGALFAWRGAHGSGWIDDAALHAIFLGFAISMVFGHAPIVVGAIVGRSMSFHAAAYAPLVLLHGSVLMRVVGWLGGITWSWRASGLVSGLAVLLFLLTTLVSLRSPQRVL